VNIITYIVRQKIPVTWYDIGEDMMYKKSMTHSG
jgi:hypothetical protein